MPTSGREQGFTALEVVLGIVAAGLIAFAIWQGLNAGFKYRALRQPVVPSPTASAPAAPPVNDHASTESSGIRRPVAC